MIQVTQEDQESKGSFIAIEKGDKIGEMTYSKANDGQLLIIDHTEVNENYKGNGVGKILFDKLVDTVRESNQKVMPLCPFTRAMFEKNKDKWDVLRHQSL